MDEDKMFYEFLDADVLWLEEWSGYYHVYSQTMNCADKSTWKNSI